MTVAITKRLLIVAGKGGVGRSTVAAALAVAAARRDSGRSSPRSPPAVTSRGRSVAGPATDWPKTEPHRGLHHVTIERRAAMGAYLRDEVPGVVPAALLARSRAFELFVAATPGMSDLLTIGKVWELAQRPRHARADPYDLIVLDAPASGNSPACSRRRERFVRSRAWARLRASARRSIARSATPAPRRWSPSRLRSRWRSPRR